MVGLALPTRKVEFARRERLNRPVTTVAAAVPERRPAWHLFIPLLGGLIVAESLGIIARELVVSPGAYPGPWFRLFFSDTLHLKAWLALGVAALAVTQLFTAAWIFRRLPWPRPRFVNVVHRWSGRLAFLLTIPVAYHCVFKLGFQTYDTRIAVHSFFGVAVYGAFATKVPDRAHAPLPEVGAPGGRRAAVRGGDRRLVDELVLVPAAGRRRDLTRSPAARAAPPRGRRLRRRPREAHRPGRPAGPRGRAPSRPRSAMRS
jgi:hypothetical protein